MEIDTCRFRNGTEPSTTVNGLRTIRRKRAELRHTVRRHLGRDSNNEVFRRRVDSALSLVGIIDFHLTPRCRAPQRQVWNVRSGEPGARGGARKEAENGDREEKGVPVSVPGSVSWGSHSLAAYSLKWSNRGG